MHFFELLTIFVHVVYVQLESEWDIILAKLQNTGPLIYISLNHKGAYCVMLRSSKDFDTCKTGGLKWPCIMAAFCCCSIIFLFFCFSFWLVSTQQAFQNRGGKQRKKEGGNFSERRNSSVFLLLPSPLPCSAPREGPLPTAPTKMHARAWACQKLTWPTRKLDFCNFSSQQAEQYIKMALSLRHVADQLFSEVRIAKEKYGHCKYPEIVFDCIQLSGALALAL